MPPVASPPVPSRTWAQRHGRVLRLVILAVAFAVVLAVPLVGLSVVGLRRADVILGSFFLAPTAFVTVLLTAAGPNSNRFRKVCRRVSLVFCAAFCVGAYVMAPGVATAVTVVAFAAAAALTVAVDATVP
ncbi:hypothetical protein [Blastococcus sp. TF02A-35]|uniref:hypothetical protein n=1 Tax=Blastococcus sp. TF02A-35 TaxID=2559612 RepID=UPI001073B7AB|nr:hypothetical protein [Blastococcus sp. TF02A_35]TFV52089.1 hypothetical protein E4P43_07555 [Blastococcus sp. TF02A_35]